MIPIRVPPLRDGAEDIPQLIRHFVRHFADRQGKAIEVVPRRSDRRVIARPRGWDCREPLISRMQRLGVTAGSGLKEAEVQHKGPASVVPTVCPITTPGQFFATQRQPRSREGSLRNSRRIARLLKQRLDSKSRYLDG